MDRDSRTAWIATPAHSVDVIRGQGTLDGEAVAERLGQDDLGFEVEVLDASDDLAGQIDDDALESAEPCRFGLLYVSAPIVADDEAVLLCLDPTDRSTGDSLADVLGSLAEACEGDVVALLDLRAPPESDALQLAELVARVREVAREVDGVELLVSVRAAGEDDASSCSPLTRSVLGALDEVDQAEGLRLADLYASVGESEWILGAKLAFGAVVAESSAWIVEPDESAEDAELPLGVGGSSPLEPRAQPVAEPAASPPPPAAGSRSPLPPEEPSPTVASPPPPAPAPSSASVPPPPPSLPPPAPASSSASVPPPSLPPPSLSIPEAPVSRRSQLPTALAETEQGDALAAAGDDEAALGFYRRALGLVGASPGAGVDASKLRASLHVRIGEAKLRQGKSREAVASFEKALGLSPDESEVDRVLKLLLSIYMGERDHRSVATVQARLLDRVSTSEERVEALVGFARAWLDDAGEPLRARALLEEARALAPREVSVLRPLLALAERDRRVDDLVELRRQLAELETDPAQRARALLALGRELIEQHRRDDDALSALEAALEAHPSELEPLALLAEILAERQEWSELEGAYLRMLDRLPSVEPLAVHARVEAEIARRLGVLLRDHLEDEAGALAALERAVAAEPDDLDSRRAASELARAAGELERALAHAQRVAESSPRSVPDLRRAFDLLLKCDHVERACHVAEVLTALGAATERERALLDAHRDDPRRPVEELPSEAWATLWRPEQGALARLFEACAEALVPALAELRRAQGDAPEILEPAKLVDTQTTTLSAPRSLAWSAKMLGVALPKVLVDDTSTVAFRIPRAAELASSIGAVALRGRSLEELSFLAGHHAATLLPAHRAVALTGNVEELSVCFLAAVRNVVVEAPLPESLAEPVRTLARSLGARLGDEARDALDLAFVDLDEQGGHVDLGAWSESVERAALAAGLLLCGDLRVAVDALELLPDGPQASRRGELLLGVAVSEAYSVLRLRMSGAEA